MHPHRRHPLVVLAGAGAVLIAVLAGLPLLSTPAPLQITSQPSPQVVALESPGRARPASTTDKATIPTAPGEPEHRHATGHRHVTFAPRCAVFSQPGDPALWSPHVDVEGDGGLLLRAKLPTKEVRCPVSRHAESLQVSVPGYGRATLQVPAGTRDLDLGEIGLQPDAAIQVTLSGVPDAKTPWLGLQLQAQLPGRVSPPGIDYHTVRRVDLASQHGKMVYSTPFPSGVEFRIDLGSRDLEAGSPGVSLRSPTIRLDPDATHHQDWRLHEVGATVFQLTGLPAAALFNQVVSVANSGVAANWRGCTARTDAAGQVRIHGVHADAFTATVAGGDGHRRLAFDPVTPQERTDGSTFVQLAPREPLVGFQFVGDTRQPARASTIVLDGPTAARYSSQRVPLLGRRAFMKSSRCNVFVAGTGQFSVPSAELRETDGLYRIQVPQGLGGLRVVTDKALEMCVTPVAERAGWITVHSDRDEVQCMVMEHKGKHRVCRGWIRVPTHTAEFELDPGGRHVTLIGDADSRSGAACPDPPGWWPFGRPGFSDVRLEDNEPTTLWMPDSAAGLVLLTSTGVPHETVPAADIGTTLRVR